MPEGISSLGGKPKEACHQPDVWLHEDLRDVLMYSFSREPQSKGFRT